MMEFQKLNFRNFFCVFSIDSKVSLEKNIPPGTMIAEKSFMKKWRKPAGISKMRFWQDIQAITDTVRNQALLRPSHKYIY